MVAEQFVQVITRMPARMHRQLKDRAALEDRTMATVVRRALRAYLATKADK